MVFNIDSKIKLVEEVAISKTGEDAILLNLETGNYFELNEQALFIVENLKSFIRIESLLINMMEQFEVNEEVCKEDLFSFVSSLNKKNLIIVSAK